jgi:hypothetical protein
MPAPAITTRRRGLASLVLASGLVAATGHAQTAAVRLLPPMPIPPLPLAPILLPGPASDGADSSSPPEAHASRSGGASVSLMTLSARSPAEREALRRSQYHEQWYGWQTLTADALATGILIFGAGFKGELRVPFIVASAGVYVVGAPAVHFARGSIGAGFESALLRLALSLAGFSVGYLLGANAGLTRDDAIQNGGFGAVVGAAGATAVDAAFLGWDRWRSPETVARTPCVGVSGNF